MLWFVLVLLMLALPETADAYVGPGAGLTVIGAAFAFIASIALAIVGFVWYPIKKLWRLVTRRDDRSEEHASHD